MGSLIETNRTLDFFSDFDKIATNVGAVALKLNQLNYLIGQQDIDARVRELWDENPKVFSVLDILIAVRAERKLKVIDDKGNTRLIDDFFTSPEGVIEYLEKTGLADLFRKRTIRNLVDYVFGVETGLDTNARKNRSGVLMSRLVSRQLDNGGIEYETEVASTRFEELQCLGEDKKVFDFVVKTRVRTYLIEVNFYGGGGSKLNEVARSYTELSAKLNAIEGYEFVWITDGVGWYQAKNKLEEAYYHIPSVYNLSTLPEFIERIKKES